MKIAYFMARYPELSQTFVQREIDYLRKNNVEIVTFAVKRAPGLQSSKARHDKAFNTIYARPDNVLFGIIANLYCLFRPLRYAKCLKAILFQMLSLPFPDVVKILFHLYSAPIFIYYLKKNRIKHIHAHFATASTIALFCNYLSDISFSFTVHASGDIYSQPILLNEKMRSSKFVIADCEYNMRYLNLITNYQFENKITVVHNGVEIADDFQYHIRHGNDIRLVSVGNFTHFKGYPTLLQAVAMVNQAGSSVSLDIVGDGSQRALIVSLIERFYLADKVKLHGTLEPSETKEVMKRGDMFVFASEIYLNGIRDGMATVCTEAMALGLPVISTYVSAIPELIENGKSGLLVAENDPKALAGAIRTLIDRPDFRYELAKSGYLRVKEKFDVNVTMKRLVKAFTDGGALV